MSRTKPTYIYAIVSVALVLYVLGFFAVTALNARQLVTLFKEKIDIWLELKPGITQEDVARIVGQVRRQPFVKKESIKFISRAEAARSMRSDLGDESLLEQMPDLLRDVVRFNVSAEYLRNDSLAQWREELRQDTLIADLYFEAANVGNVSKNIENIGWITLILGFLLVFAAITLIHNTIRLALFSNRFLIKNQELVGASWGFITRPYIQRGLWNGLISAIIAIAVLVATLAWIQHLIPEIADLQSTNDTVLIYFALAVTGLLISGLSTWFVVNKFLRMRIDDLY